MFKAKLNELCQKSRWGYLPMYSLTKHGPDHDPSFRATIVVNGLTFGSSSDFKKCKAAENDVAEIAFNHFRTSSEIPIDGMKKTKKRKLSVMRESSDLKTVKEEVPNAPASISSSNLNTGDFDVTKKSSLPVLPSKVPTQIAPSDHSMVSNEYFEKKPVKCYMQRDKAIEDMSGTNSKKPVNSYMLRKRVKTSKGTVVLPIAKNK